jgi:polysaccharide biosynthesis protein PslH
VTYGIENSSIPSMQEVQDAKDYVRSKHAIAPAEKIVLFAGSFSYRPNRDAFEFIDKRIAPLLYENGFACKILICGPGLDTRSSTHPSVCIAGFVDDISVYFKASDIFINPTVEGGGIKTKLVEALGYNVNAVSTENGAIGVNPSLCNGKLLIVKDNQWADFSAGIIAASKIQADIAQEYYQHFYWGYSTKKAAEFITEAF